MKDNLTTTSSTQPEPSMVKKPWSKPDLVELNVVNTENTNAMALINDGTNDSS